MNSQMVTLVSSTRCYIICATSDASEPLILRASPVPRLDTARAVAALDVPVTSTSRALPISADEPENENLASEPVKAVAADSAINREPVLKLSAL